MREKMRENLLEDNLEQKGLFNLKQSKGGIADIEFITQYLVLKFASSEPNLAISSNTSELLSFLARNNLSGDVRLKDLVPLYAELRRIVNANAIQNQSSTVDQKETESLNTELVIQLWNDLLGT